MIPLSINDCLLRIKSLVESPHWTADRKDRISELCDIAIAQLPVAISGPAKLAEDFGGTQVGEAVVIPKPLKLSGNVANQGRRSRGVQ